MDPFAVGARRQAESKGWHGALLLLSKSIHWSIICLFTIASWLQWIVRSSRERSEGGFGSYIWYGGFHVPSPSKRLYVG
jgi:hypothetical protein